jgi:hypothetical protein
LGRCCLLLLLSLIRARRQCGVNFGEGHHPALPKTLLQHLLLAGGTRDRVRGNGYWYGGEGYRGQRSCRQCRCG